MRIVLVIGFGLVLAFYLPNLGGQYVYDDFTCLETNADLNQVKTFRDCFRFKLQPSRPVSNLFLALTYWAGGSAPTSQRAVSLALHLFASCLLLLNLQLLGRRLKLKAPYALLSMAVTLYFALHPMHVSHLRIVVFRWEILATLFTLVAAWFAQCLAEASSRQRVWYFTGLFFALGSAALSKEPYVVLAPLTAVLVYFVHPPKERSGRRIFLGLVAGMSLVWAGAVAYLLTLPSSFPYALGRHPIPLTVHLPQAARSLVEEVAKLLGGYRLTLLRLNERGGLMADVGLIASVVTLLVGVMTGIGLWFLGGWWRMWGTIFFVGNLIYLGIPSENIGSEHYYYFLSIPFFALAVAGLLRAFPRPTQSKLRLLYALLGAHLACLAGVTINRNFELRSRMSQFTSEVEKHPESWRAWSDYIGYIGAEAGGWAPAKSAIEEALKRFPKLPYFHYYAYVLHQQLGDPQGAEAVLRAMAKKGLDSQGQAFVYFHAANLAAGASDCPRTMRAIASARELNAADPEIIAAEAQFREMCRLKKN